MVPLALLGVVTEPGVTPSPPHTQVRCGPPQLPVGVGDRPLLQGGSRGSWLDAYVGRGLKHPSTSDSAWWKLAEGLSEGLPALACGRHSSLDTLSDDLTVPWIVCHLESQWLTCSISLPSWIYSERV